MNTLRSHLSLVWVTLLIASSPVAHADLFSRKSVAGATGGAIAGGIIGHQSDHGTEGAVVGALAGFALGNLLELHSDRDEDRPDLPGILSRPSSKGLTEPAFTLPAPAPQEARDPQPRSFSDPQQRLLQANRLFTVRPRPD